MLPMVAMSQGDLYKHYASRTDIAVAQVSGFKLNDSVRVDVVLLVADNSAAWKRLTQELGVSVADGVESWLGDMKQPSRRVRWTGKTVMRVVVSHSRRTVGFYRIDNEKQYDALLDYQLEKMKSKK